MASGVNIIRNPIFADGEVGPLGWVFSGTSRAVRWRRGAGDHPVDGAGVIVECDDPRENAVWSQVVVCKPGEYYRVEAVGGGEVSGADESAGFVLAVEPIEDGKPVGHPKVTPALHRASQPITVRAIYQAPEGIRRLRVSVGLLGAKGRAFVHEVRFIKILEPDEVSHPHAIPAPPFTLHAPRVVEEIGVCSGRAAERPLTGLLAGCFGVEHVRAFPPSGLVPAKRQADALLLLDSTPPPSIRSLRGLVTLATDRIVVISLPAFVALSRGQLRLRRIEQDDDPTFAKVAYASYATRGFALHDTFVYGWPGRNPGSFVQNQFRNTAAFESFCEKHRFKTLLVSMCDQDRTSNRPIALYKATTGGGLFVLDLEPAETEDSTSGESALAMHLLLSILGRPQARIGQFAAPIRNEGDFRSAIRELGPRFEHFVVHDADVPADEVTDQLVTVGREDLSYGRPLQPKRVILVRTGLVSGDVASVYGAWLWFKQLVRTDPFACPYAHQLASQFRLAWIPSVAPWEAPDGWLRSGRPPSVPMTVEIDDAEIAALIEVVSVPLNRVRVVLPSLDEGHRRYAKWLPQLASGFGPGRFFVPSPPEGASFRDRDRFAWRHVSHELEVTSEPALLEGQVHHEVLEAGGEVVRIEVPGHDADFAAYSIQRTDLIATVLEHVIGLQFGLIAVNRQSRAVILDGLPPAAPGEALILDQRQLATQLHASRGAQPPPRSAARPRDAEEIPPFADSSELNDTAASWAISDTA